MLSVECKPRSGLLAVYRVCSYTVKNKLGRQYVGTKCRSTESATLQVLLYTYFPIAVRQ